MHLADFDALRSQATRQQSETVGGAAFMIPLLQLVVCVRATFAVVNVALKLSSILVLVAIQLTGLSCTIHLQSEIRLIPNC